MRMKITRWSPSTCKCVIDYEWDRDLSEDQRTHKFVSVQHCGQDHPKAVVGEQVEGSEFHKDHVAKNQKAIPASVN